jgi:hypothetical protein
MISTEPPAIFTEPPSVTRLALASGTPLYSDPYLKGILGSYGERSVLFDDPIETVGELGHAAAVCWLTELVNRAHGDVTLVPSGPLSEHLLARAPCADPPHPLLVDVCAQVQSLEDVAVRGQADEILARLAEHLPTSGHGLSAAVFSSLDDGSIIIEFPLVERRLGFTIRPLRAESGWFFVSGPNWANIMASGALDEAPVEQLASWVVSSPGSSK